MLRLTHIRTYTERCCQCIITDPVWAKLWRRSHPEGSLEKGSSEDRRNWYSKALTNLLYQFLRLHQSVYMPVRMHRRRSRAFEEWHSEFCRQALHMRGPKSIGRSELHVNVPMSRKLAGAKGGGFSKRYTHMQ